MTRQPLSEPPRLQGIFRYFLPAFGVIFLLAGSLMLWFLTIQALRQLLEARSWTPTECKILQSTIESKTDSDGTTYQPRIGYEYLVAGKRYSSTRYNFFSIWSNRSWAEKIVAAYKTGTNHPCYYNPAKPDEAVLNRDFSGLGFWFGVLFPWPFIFVGGGVLFFSLRRTHSKPMLASDSEPPAHDHALLPEVGQSRMATSFGEPSGDQTTGHSLSDGKTRRATPSPYSERASWAEFVGPKKLKPVSSRIGVVIGVGLFALLWNTFIGIFANNAFIGRQWFSLLFMLPFLIAGIFLIGATVYSLLKLFNPTVELAISEGAVPLGDSLDVAWELKGRVSRIRELVISAVGEEQATYTRGTDTKTDKNVFQSIEIARTSAVADMQFGTATVVIPLETMHSHFGERNKIVWKLIVQGEIPFFPNVYEEFEFRVIPRGDV